MIRALFASLLLTCTLGPPVAAQDAPPPAVDPAIQSMVDAVEADRIEADVQTMVDFHTRHTLSDTTSDERGVGAARRWLKAEFERISDDCGGCLEVMYQKTVVEAGETERIPGDTPVYNVVAIQRGTEHPDRYVLMGGHLDSRVSSIMDSTSRAPGANDDASGVAGAVEAARVLSQHEFESSIVYVGYTGEEQGLFGSTHAAETAVEEDWTMAGVLNNDMIGNIEGIDGVIENNTFRVFSQRRPPDLHEDSWATRYYGGENDGPSRQLARYVATQAETYVRHLEPILIYRLDRFGRGGDQMPFADRGFPAVRVMETHENYNRQHQDLRTEDGIEYGDTIDEVNFGYAEKLTGVNVATMASIAAGPPRPDSVRIGGAVSPSTTLAWDPVDHSDLAGYKVYWRRTAAPRWQHSTFVPAGTTEHTLENVVIDNWFFGVAAVDEEGHESPVVFPSALLD
ncbi:MAG: M28 family metallopeptidase [Salinivenus sp.]